MTTSRRDFLKHSALASATMMSGLKAWAGTATPTSSARADASTAANVADGDVTLGLGVYPGLPSENFAPTLVADNAYRNLALLRPAFHSSAHDYNLTAQLVTDGVKESRLPAWIEAIDSTRGALPKEEREAIFDHFPMEQTEMRGARASVELRLKGGDEAPEVDRVELRVIAPQGVDAKHVRLTVLTSEDGREWTEAGVAAAPEPASLRGYPPNYARPESFFAPSIPFQAAVRARYYKVECRATNMAVGTEADPYIVWKMGEAAFYKGKTRVELVGPHKFVSAWKSAGLGEEWVCVDLGARFRFDRVKLFWLARAAEGCVESSDDRESWKEIARLDGRTESVDDLTVEGEGRYVRVRMTRPTSADGYMLSEVEVWGKGGFVSKPKPAPAAAADGSLVLAGGNWRLQRDSFVTAAGEQIAKTGFQDEDWLVATVPGTVLTSYLNAGAIADPNYGQNQLHISDSFFYADFWYRNEFVAPEAAPNKRVWLHFDGVNWKAEVYLNGEKLGRVEGGFQRGRFDVTHKILPGKTNALAVRIEKNATPGSVHQKTFALASKNGGALGVDNPTYHASAGWDWIPTIRGRNTGLWGAVTLTQTGAVSIENPHVWSKLPLPQTTSAEIHVECELVNHQDKPVNGVLKGRFGDVPFEQKIKLAAQATQKIVLSPATHAQLLMKNPRLWWPAGYGEPTLHDVSLHFDVEGHTQDTKSFKAGIRQMTWSEEGGKLRLFVNGRRFIARGGNWGFGESMLRYRAREYDAAIRYHKEMHFNLIRNWVGQIGDDAFYEACDKHGVMVWQDFWLANPWDGVEPTDTHLYLENAKDTVLRIRNHASLAIYCGRNEGYPPKALEEGVRAILGELHGNLYYIPSSADGVVSGHGPYESLPPEFYFQHADVRLHSEIGAPAVPPIESVRLFMDEKALWPHGLDWGLHDLCQSGAMNGAGLRAMIENHYGGAANGTEWIDLAQYVNYDSYRAMFEAQSKYRMGLLLWMSHACWPSFVWQTYDYYFEPTSVYYACKKACEPIHIQWNPHEDTLEVVNYNAGRQSGLTATLEILNLDGKLVESRTATLDMDEDATQTLFRMKYPKGLSTVHFLRMKLTKGAEELSTNFYLRGLEAGNYRAIRALPKAKIDVRTTAEEKDGVWRMRTEVRNASSTPALNVRVKAVREKSGDRILPAIYSDNYIALMPGESRVLTVEFHERDTRGEKPMVVVA